MNYPVIRGILIGGAVGVFAVLFGIADSMPMAFGLGMIAGACAGLTMKWRLSKRAKLPKNSEKKLISNIIIYLYICDVGW